jgi:hypothetical protein
MLVITIEFTIKIPDQFLAHLCIGGWRPHGKSFFDVAATFGRARGA